MKRIICLVAVVVCVAACQRESCPDYGDRSVVFSTDVRKPDTKSVVTDVTESNFNQFNIMAYVHGQETPYFGEEQTAVRQTAGSLHGYFMTPVYFYWPLDLSLDFFAYCGAGVSDEGISNEGGEASIRYTVPPQADEDLVVSSELNCSKSDARSVGATSWSQKLVFTHALVKIDTVLVNVFDDGIYNTADYMFTVDSIYIKGAANSGVYNYKSSSGAAKWTDAGGSVDYVFTVPSSPFPGNSSCILMADGTHVEQFIILPQRVEFCVTYSVAHAAGGDPVLEKTAYAYLTLVMGKAYKIVLSLSGPGVHATSMANPSGWVY